MNIQNICRIGGFDKVVLDGFTVPHYNTRGITLNSDNNIGYMLDDNLYRAGININRLRLRIFGETDSIVDDLNLKYEIVDKAYRYEVAWADIYILSDIAQYSITQLSINNNSIDAELLDVAISICNSFKNRFNSNVKIAVFNRLYVHQQFRGCGISTWIHNNFNDIVGNYYGTKISQCIFTAADFANESITFFNMTKESYVNKLKNYYLGLGYKLINNRIFTKKY